MAIPSYVEGAELGDLEITWRDVTGAVIDFSTGWTFELRVGTAGEGAIFAKTTDITGAATAPNLVVRWATTGELHDVPPGVWAIQIDATRTADSRRRTLKASIHIDRAILPVA